MRSTTPRASRSPTPRPPTARSRPAGNAAASSAKLVNPANTRKLTVIVVGTGLAGGSAAAPRWPSWATTSSRFCFQDSPRRAHSHRRPGRHQRRQELPQRRRQRLPALLRHGQGRRLPRPRVQRLPARRDRRSTSSTSAWPRACRSPASTAACSTPAPSAARRSRAPSTPAARPASSCCSAPTRRWSGRSRAGNGRDDTRARDARPDRRRRPGPRHRRPRPGHRRDRSRTSPTPSCSPPAATATSSTCRPTPRAATSPRSGGRTASGALFANPCYTQIHPTCIPVTGDHQSKLTLMSESLRNDGRVWVPEGQGDDRAAATRSPRTSATTTWSAMYPAFGNLVPRDIASRAAKNVCDEGRGVGPGGLGVYLDFADAIQPAGPRRPSRRSTATSSRCTSASPARTRTRCRCASTRPCTTRWAACGSTTTCRRTIPGLFVIGEANFSDHGANRLGASRADAGPGRRLLRAAVHDRRLPGAATRSSQVDRRRTRRSSRPRPRSRTGIDRLLVDRRRPHRRLVPPRAGPAHVGLLRHGAHRRGPAQGARADPASCARSSGATSRCPATARS